MQHTISVLVANRFGVLSRVSGLFSGRGFNIDSLTVAETHDPEVSRMTIVTRGDDKIIEQITKQLNKLVDVIKVSDLTGESFIDRELVMVKVQVNAENRAELLGIVDIFRCKVVDVSPKSYALEATGDDSYTFSKADSWRAGHHTLGAFRPTEPLKSLFFPAREFIGRWQDGGGREPLPERIVFGVKNCDLSSLAVFDYVFLHGVAKDPYYAEARDKTLLVSADCTGQREVCFCTAVGEQPFPQANFDIRGLQGLQQSGLGR